MIIFTSHFIYYTTLANKNDEIQGPFIFETSNIITYCLKSIHINMSSTQKIIFDISTYAGKCVLRISLRTKTDPNNSEESTIITDQFAL